MIGSSSVEVERKALAILRVLQETNEPLGARIIARQLKEHGIDLTERAVRYHLKLMDERGLTRSVGRDGRVITTAGMEEVQNALVSDKVGFVINRIELLAYQTTFDCKTSTGLVPMNTSFIPTAKMDQALAAMKKVFKAGLCVSDLVAVAKEGETLGETVVPKGKVGLATVCSIVVNGALLRSGVPINSVFGGILQIRQRQPLRFVELIHYAGSSLDASGVFIRGRMTTVAQAARRGEGKVLANFREIPAQCHSVAGAVIAELREARLGGLMAMGHPGESVCEVPVGTDRVGIILIGGMNPIAAVEESGIETENYAMTSVIEYGRLGSFWDL